MGKEWWIGEVKWEMHALTTQHPLFQETIPLPFHIHSHQTMWFVPGMGRQGVRPGPSKHEGLSSYFQWLVWKWATGLCRTNQSLLVAFNQKDQKQFLSSSRISSYQDQRVWSCHAAYHVETVCLKIKLHWGKQSWDMERVVQMAAGTTHSWQPYQKSLKFQSHKPT